MKIAEFEGLTYIKSPLFEKYGVEHLFTTVKDSKKEKRTDYTFRNNDKQEILENYKKIADFFNVPIEHIVKSTQIHEDNIEKVTHENKGMGVTKDTSFDNADGIYTPEKDIPLCIFSADCVPVLIADKSKKVVMAVHAGWRGSAKNILGKAIRILKDEYKINTEDILVAIGPAIGQCCFEVSCDVIEELGKVYKNDDCYYKKENGKYQLDLKKFNKQLALIEGVLEENIDLCNLCTKCDSEYFHSYRREREAAGRNAAFIML